MARFEKLGYTIARCESCGLIQLHPLPAQETLDSLYSDDYFASSGRGAGYDDYAEQQTEYEATFTEEINRFRPFVPSGKVLDVGCGYGYFIGAALTAGYDAYGIDVAPGAVKRASRDYPGRAFHGQISEIPALRDAQFDVIFISHLIEHVTTPVQFLNDLTARLSPNGIIVIVTPDIGSLLARVSGRRWVSFKVPEHVAYYDRQTMAKLLAEGGLQPLRMEGAHQYYRLPFVAKRLRELVYPLSRLVPPLERLPYLRDAMVRVHSGSLRAIARRALSS